MPQDAHHQTEEPVQLGVLHRGHFLHRVMLEQHAVSRACCGVDVEFHAERQQLGPIQHADDEGTKKYVDDSVVLDEKFAKNTNS